MVGSLCTTDNVDTSVQCSQADWVGWLCLAFGNLTSLQIIELIFYEFIPVAVYRKSIGL